MSGDKILIGSLLLILGLSLGYLFAPRASAPLGNSYPVLSASSISHGRAPLAGYGAVVIGNASNTGDWFKISLGSTSTGGVWCGASLNATGSDVARSGTFLVPVTSSTGDHF